jgi:hypothetical protein
MANAEVWRLFIEALCRYQYVRTPAPPTQELMDVLYDESQGITDFAVKIFVLAQVRAIVTGVETITKALIRSVAHDSLRLARPVLQALRTGNKAALATMSDIHPIDIRSAIHDMQFARLARSLGPKTEITSGNTPQFAAQSEIVVNPPGSSAEALIAAEDLLRNKIRKPKKAEDDSRCLLIQVAQAGKKQGKSAHDSLAGAGLIKAMLGPPETHAIG